MVTNSAVCSTNIELAFTPYVFSVILKLCISYWFLYILELCVTQKNADWTGDTERTGALD